VKVASFAAAVALLAGCGADEPRSRSTSAVPPAIESIDEPVPSDVEAGYRALARGLPAGLKARPEQRAFLEAIAPAEDAELRRVARLRLTGPRAGVVLDLIAWRSRSGSLCTLGHAGTPTNRDLGGVGPNGPCVPMDRCEALCVDEGWIEVDERSSSVLAGTVFSEADELRLSLLGGGETRIRLTGPLLRGFRGRRVVLVDLGRSSATRIELLRGGVTIASRDGTGAYDYATEDCMTAALAAPTEADRERRRRDCI
jgi:hypothetical protein